MIKVSLTENEQAAILWAKKYRDNTPLMEKMIIENESVRYCISELYLSFAREEKIQRIERLEENQKAEIFERAKELFMDRLTKKNAKRVCVVLYFLNFLFEKYF